MAGSEVTPQVPVWDEFWSSQAPPGMHQNAGQRPGGDCTTSGALHNPANSEHVMTATGVDRGATPAVWNAVGQPARTGPWAGVDHESGPADRDGHATGCFETGSGRWEQT